MKTNLAVAPDLPVPVAPHPDRRRVPIRTLFPGIKGKGVLSLCTQFLAPSDPEAVPAVEPGYYQRPDLVVAVLYALEKNMPLFVWGPTGCGKTTGIEQVCAALRRPVTRLNMDADLSRAEIFGAWTISGNRAMVWRDAPLVQALRRGHVIILDELDAAPAHVLLGLQAVLEKRPLTLLDSGEVVPPHPDCRLFATGNTSGGGDESGIYHGTQPQNFAFRDRFNLVVKLDYPTEAEERFLLHKKLGDLFPEETYAALCQYAARVRKAHVEGQTLATISSRALLHLAETAAAFGDWDEAFRICLFNRLNGDDLSVFEKLRDIVWRN